MSEWPVGIIVAAVAAALLLACRYLPRSRQVRHGGQVYFKQPDGSFVDRAKKPVTDSELAAILGGVAAATQASPSGTEGSSGSAAN